MASRAAIGAARRAVLCWVQSLALGPVSLISPIVACYSVSTLAFGAVLLVAALVFWRLLEAGFIGERREAVAFLRRERVVEEERAGYAGHVGPRGLICVAFPADGRGRRAERCSYSVGVAQLDAEEAVAFCFLLFALRWSAAEASRCGAASMALFCDSWWVQGSTAAEADEDKG